MLYNQHPSETLNPQPSTVNNILHPELSAHRPKNSTLHAKLCTCILAYSSSLMGASMVLSTLIAALNVDPIAVVPILTAWHHM